MIVESLVNMYKHTEVSPSAGNMDQLMLHVHFKAIYEQMFTSIQ